MTTDRPEGLAPCVSGCLTDSVCTAMAVRMGAWAHAPLPCGGSQVILSFASAFWDKVQIIDRISAGGDGAWQEFLNVHFYTGCWWGGAMRLCAPLSDCLWVVAGWATAWL